MLLRIGEFSSVADQETRLTAAEENIQGSFHNLVGHIPTF